MTQISKFPIRAFVAAIVLLVISGPAAQTFAQDATAKNGRPPKPKYTAAQLNKVQTLQLVASSNNARTETLYSSIRPYLTPQQQRQCRQLVATYKNDFDRLKNQRSQIMENASDDNGTPQKLLDWRSGVLDLAKEIRQDLRASVLTARQRKEHHREWLRQNELKAEKARQAQRAANSSVEKKVVLP